MPGLFFILNQLYILYMNVILADVLGYCMGVRRAVDSAIETLKNNQNNKVYSLGPLIHNQVALDKLSSMGLKVLREPNIDLLDEKSVVIIRAHGVPPQVIEKLTEKKYIHVRCATIRNKIVIEIMNSCETQQSGKVRPLTTKLDKGSHGYGLQNVEDVVKKYNGTIDYDRAQDRFRLSIVM